MYFYLTQSEISHHKLRTTAQNDSWVTVNKTQTYLPEEKQFSHRGNDPVISKLTRNLSFSLIHHPLITLKPRAVRIQKYFPSILWPSILVVGASFQMKRSTLFGWVHCSFTSITRGHRVCFRKNLPKKKRTTTLNGGKKKQTFPWPASTEGCVSEKSMFEKSWWNLEWKVCWLMTYFKTYQLKNSITKYWKVALFYKNAINKKIGHSRVEHCDFSNIVFFSETPYSSAWGYSCSSFSNIEGCCLLAFPFLYVLNLGIHIDSIPYLSLKKAPFLFAPPCRWLRKLIWWSSSVPVVRRS